VLEVTEDAALAAYQDAARAAITEIHARWRDAIFVGGSGLYVSSVLYVFRFPPRDPGLRARLEKTHLARSVPFPDFLDTAIRMLCRGKSCEDLLFGDGARPMRLPNSKAGWFAGAVRRAQKIDPDFRRITPHDLRHTAASLAVSAGANVKALQRMLGHASAAMTLDTYADLFDDDLDTVAAALSNARRSSIVTIAEHPRYLEAPQTAFSEQPDLGSSLDR